MANRYRCKKCLKNITASGKSPQLRYRKHDDADGTECENSRTIIPAWIVKRGPETDESDVPAVGRDYAPCPECGRSPLLDGEGKFMLHVIKPGVPSGERITCPMSGEPYVAPEGEQCSHAPTTPTPDPSADTACAAPSTPPTSSEKNAPSATAAGSGTPADTASPATEAEQMISKWAAQAREIEDRHLPETTEPSPESTPTQPDLPPRPNAPEAPPAPASEPASTAAAASKREDAAEPAAPARADASPSETPNSDGTGSAKASGPPPDIAALAAIFPRSARTPDGTPTGDAVPAPADALATATQAVQAMMPGARVEYDATPLGVLTPTRDAAPSTAATPMTRADAPPSSDRLVMTGHTCKMGGPPELGGHTVDCVLTLEEKPQFLQPGFPFSQPDKAPVAVTDPIPMTVLAEQVVARMKEIFYAYTNQLERSVQTTMGPSEIGTPCDRRVAMSLLRIPPVNPGGDGWASWVGTCIHAGLAEMFMWADKGQGRFAVEVPLTFPNEHVPKGTSDLLDRVLFMVDDHKAQGRWALDKLKTQGIPPGYRVQLHVYGYGQRLKGERIDYVCLISWPREASNLADMYAVVERYDPDVAREALARVDRIAGEVKAYETERATWAGLDITAHKLGIAREFAAVDDCRFCPFFAPGDPDMTRGCPGR
ncbi:hypothetical protein [Streptomyces chartreusis]